MRWLKLFFTHKPLATQNNRIGGHSYQNLIRSSGRSPKSLVNTGFFGFFKLFPLDSAHGLGSEVVEDAVDTVYLAGDSVGDFVEKCIRYLLDGG